MGDQDLLCSAAAHEAVLHSYMAGQGDYVALASHHLQQRAEDLRCTALGIVDIPDPSTVG
jgi:hypothetical protein